MGVGCGSSYCDPSPQASSARQTKKENRTADDPRPVSTDRRHQEQRQELSGPLSPPLRHRMRGREMKNGTGKSQNKGHSTEGAANGEQKRGRSKPAPRLIARPEFRFHYFCSVRSSSVRNKPHPSSSHTPTPYSSLATRLLHDVPEV